MDDASGDRSYYSRPSGNPNTRHPISSFQQQQLAQGLELAPADLVSSPRLTTLTRPAYSATSLVR